MNEVFKALLIQGVTPNMYYVLLCIKDSKSHSKLINVHLELRQLKGDGWLTDKDQLTAKSILLFSNIESMIKTSSKVNILIDDDHVDKYLEIFPSMILPSNKAARVSKKTIRDCFTWFFNNYEYTWETILKATDYYVSKFERDKYMFMRNSQYFICKTLPDRTKESDLASYCEIVDSGNLPEEHHFSEKVV